MKIELRPWSTEDIPELAYLANDIYVWKHVRDYFPHPYGEKDAEEFIKMASAKALTEDYAVIVDGQVAGGAGIVTQGDVHRLSAEVGYWLGKPFRGRGIMPEAVRLLTEKVFSETDIIHLYAGVFGFNAPSVKVLEKAGFSKAGIMRSCVVKNGVITDLHYYEKLK